MILTIRKRTLILSIVVSILALVVFIVLPGRKQPAAQATATPSPTATPLPWWSLRQGDTETGRQGDKETRRQGDKENISPSPRLPLSPSPLATLLP